MVDTLEPITKQHVEKRIADWKERISNLYTSIASWIEGSGYTLKLGNRLVMFEELMDQFNIPPTKVDSANIYKSDKFILAFKPSGLWVIGANGKIDIISLHGNYTLIDLSEQFSNSQWKLYNGVKDNAVDFNRETFLKLLK